MSTTSLPRVLSIGQCGLDHGAIANLFRSSFGVPVDAADDLEEADAHLAARTYGLILVNRKLDSDGTSGLTIVAQLAARDPKVPIMLVSNRPDAQHEAVRHGALEGFGKADLDSEQTLSRMQKALGLKNG